MKFGKQINDIIMILKTKFHQNPHHHFGFMIKYLKVVSTGNESAMTMSTSSQCQKEKPSKIIFSTFKRDENPHGLPNGPDFDAGIFEISRGCIQVVEPPTLLFN